MLSVNLFLTLHSILNLQIYREVKALYGENDVCSYSMQTLDLYEFSQ